MKNLFQLCFKLKKLKLTKLLFQKNASMVLLKIKLKHFILDILK